MQTFLFQLRAKKRKITRRIKERLGKGKIKKALSLAEKISQQSDPVETVNSLIAKPSYDKNVLWLALLHLYEKRNPKFDSLINDVGELKCKEIANLLGMRKHLSSPAAISEEKLIYYASFIDSRHGRVSNEKEYRRLLMSLIIKSLPSGKALCTFENFGLMGSLTLHQALKILKKASMEDELNVFNKVELSYKDRMTPVAEIKVLFWKSKLDEIGALSYDSLQEEFCSLSCKLSNEYRNYLLPLFKKIAIENSLLDAYVRKNNLFFIKDMIRSAIVGKQGFSFVRFNDGEGYGFSNPPLFAFDMERQELHWWGEVLAPELREKIQEDFRLSLRQHDIVGIPSVFRFIDELSINRDYSIFTNALLGRLFTLCHGYLKVYNGRAYITEGQINLYLFDREYIVKLAKLANHVVFISGAKREYLQSVFKDLHHAKYIELPTHRLLRTEKFSYSEASQPLPYVYEDYLEQIRKLAGPGVVFFISAGFIGKIFSAEVSKNGGVALDVGQTLMNIVASHTDV